ncbi:MULTISPECIES: peptidylprolyl isomerase [unclassified Bradyrhizobium]|uniref:peptidylprolyl isomerase n=1 Tax=unclassified Bradyrhizobium TaxID=2631580 RepID=UPI00247B17E9|nr:MULTISPECIES: peptidylprolyl isomerase [unclassified Bradyrhizobium]WGS19728.1 peptidylprolyl isomerase [Bradyrhizobium sp. ISRA463]WGS26572.1 peptidylprolyl isomerase [Bradyrhizobium sp. ISRA464]
MSDATQAFAISPSQQTDRCAENAADTATRPSRSIASSVMQFLQREPLVHFAILGALIFGADAVLHPPAKDDKAITVTRALRQSFIDGFDEDKERTPTDAELASRIENWVADEILYREGKALGVDRGDDMIHDRIVFKLKELLLEQVHAAQPTEAQLRGWFAKNHERFDQPETVGLYYTPAADEVTARRWLDDILSQRESEEIRNQTRAILARPVASLSPAFGEAFRDGLLKLPQGEWSLLQSKDGWHVVRLDSHREGTLAKFEDVKEQATKLWLSEETNRQAWEAINRLKASYKVRYE